nr:PREDICTED: protein diaphanous homolog 3-like [Latimeria chalumnae]|eukprot:XP_006010384.1 PREDICTED: protein diaphanous homolog 3-like [Latimeria chalumnae]
MHLNIRTLTDDVLDRFASIRIPGRGRERPNIPPLKQLHSSGSEWFSSEMEEFTPRQLSEKEILALFEKMMEDMNLNEDRKAPLREKDFSIKKEMVMQYIGTASKTCGKIAVGFHLGMIVMFITLKHNLEKKYVVNCLISGKMAQDKHLFNHQRHMTKSCAKDSGNECSKYRSKNSVSSFGNLLDVQFLLK